MTISSEIRKAGPYNGNGATTSFPFAFKVFSKADIEVVRTSPAGVETALVLDSDYSVTLNADQDNTPGGTITYPISGTALGAGYKLTIIGAVPYTQVADITNAGAFYPQVIENALDRTTIQIQQIRELQSRAITVAVSDTVDVSLPPAQPNTIIGWNDDGTALENFDPSAVSTTIVYGTSRADTFTGNGTTTAFTLTESPGALNNLDVSIGGEVQVPGVDYTWPGGTSLVMASPVPNGAVLLVKYKVALAQGTLDAASVSFAPTGTISATNVQDALAEVAAEAGGGGGGGSNDIVSIKQAPYSAVGDGVTDDSAAFTAAEASALKRFFLPEGTYIVNGVTLTKFYWGNGKILLNGVSFSGHNSANITTDPNFNTTSTTLSAGASAGATSITVASAALIKPGCQVRINDGTRAESHIVYTVVGATLTFNTSPSDPLLYGYSAGTTVDVSYPGAYGMEGDISRVIADRFTLAAGTRQGLDKLYFDGTVTPRVSMFTNGGGHSGVSARLMANASIGATSITVNTAGSDFAVNRQMAFTDGVNPNGNNYMDVVKITGIVGNVISFTPALTQAYKVGAKVSTAVRTMNQYYFNETTHNGGGDSYCFTGRMVVGNTNQQAGQNHFFYTATGGLFGGDLVGIKNGVYLTATETNQLDNGYNIAAIGDVRSFHRTNDPRAQIDTTLASGVSAGATSISLTTAIGALTSGGTLTFIGPAAGNTETQYISSVSGSTVTLLQGTNYAYSAGTRVVYQASCARTTLSAGASGGATTITVASNAYMATGTSSVTITDGMNYDTSVVANVAGTTITLSTPLTASYSSGAAVLVQNETTNPFGVTWLGALYKSEGTKSGDAVVSGVGRWKTGLNLGMADFSSHNNAAIVLNKGHRIYFNSYRSYDVAGVGVWSNFAGDTYQHVSVSNRFEHVVGNRVVMDYDQNGGVMRKTWGFDIGAYFRPSYGITFDGSGGNHKLMYESSFTRCRVSGTDVMLWDNASVYINGALRSGGGIYLFGSSATISTSATAGGAIALPATPYTYLTIYINGTAYKLPVYNA